MKTFNITLNRLVTFPILAADEIEAKDTLADLLVEREMYSLYDYPEELRNQGIDTDDHYGNQGIYLHITEIKELDFPQSFIVDGEEFILGAILQNGDAYYLSNQETIVRANDFAWSPEEIDNDGNIVLEEFAVNGLFFDDDISMLLEKGTEILTAEMHEFIRKEMSK